MWKDFKSVFEMRNQWRKKQQLPVGLWYNKWPRDFAGSLASHLSPLALTILIWQMKGLNKVSCFKNSTESGGLVTGNLDSQRACLGSLNWHGILAKFKTLFCLLHLGQLCSGQQPLPSPLLVLRFPAYCLFRHCSFLIDVRTPLQRSWEVNHRPQVNSPFNFQ